MTEISLTERILQTCKEARLAGQYVEIDFMLPSILYQRTPDNIFHFQEEAAGQLIELYRATAEQTGLALRDVVLWGAQGWDMEGTKLTVRG